MANLIITFGKVRGTEATSVPLEDAMAGLTEELELFPYSHESSNACPPGFGVVTLYAEADCWWIAVGNNDDDVPETSERRRFMPASTERQYSIRPGASIRVVEG